MLIPLLPTLPLPDKRIYRTLASEIAALSTARARRELCGELLWNFTVGEWTDIVSAGMAILSFRYLYLKG